MKWILATVSALAIAASPALAQGNGNGNGGGNGNRGGQSEHSGHGNGGGNGGQAMRDNRGNGGGNGGQAMRDNRGNGGGNENRGSGGGNENRGNGGGNDNRGNAGGNDNRGNAGGNDNRGGPPVRVENRGNGNNGNNGNGRDVVRIDDRNGRDVVRIDDGRRFGTRYISTGLLDGCPPGLARKNNGCNPPGQLRDERRYRYYDYAPRWWGLRDMRDGRWFYRDGYLLRLSGDRIGAYIPLFGGALAIGNPWPVGYGYNALPTYYVDYYGLGGPDRYRYADNVVYRLDPETAAITSIAALLTGDEFVVGSPMPRGYDVYNVPYAYRDRYYDRPGAMYRYSDGYVYQVDPETMLIASAIQLLV